MSVARGVTPTFTLTFRDISGLDFTAATNVYVTFSSGKSIITKTGEDLVLTKNTIDVLLSQKDTLSFPVGDVEVQANWTTTNGKRIASQISKIQIDKQLLERVIE